MEIITIRDTDEIDEIESEEVEMYEINPDLGDDRIIIEGPIYKLQGTSYFIAEGTYCNGTEDGELEPDFSVSLIYEGDDEPDLNSPLYWEQDPPGTMLHNYIYACDLDELKPFLLNIA